MRLIHLSASAVCDGLKKIFFIIFPKLRLSHFQNEIASRVRLSESHSIVMMYIVCLIYNLTDA